MFLRHYLLLALAIALGIALSGVARAVLVPWLGEGLLLSGAMAALWTVALAAIVVYNREFRTPARPPTPPAAPPPLPVPDVPAPAASDAPAYPRSLRQMRRRYQALYDEAFARQSRKP